MKRLFGSFGKSEPKTPPPSLDDATKNVSKIIFKKKTNSIFILIVNNAHHNNY